MKTYKHLSEDERYVIQQGLDAKTSFKKIAASLGRDCGTISKEVRARRTFKQSGAMGSPFNDCVYRRECTENMLCSEGPCRGKHCKRCQKMPCHKICTNYEKIMCERRETPPYVCNGCELKSRCTLEKAMYSARGAQSEYKSVMRETRSGICADEDEIQRLDAIFSARIKNGQSIHNIMSTSQDEVMWSEKTIYNYIDKGLLSAGNTDLARKVRFRPRKSKHDTLKVDKKCRQGRTYDDFNNFRGDNPDIHIVEMDTVFGKMGGKCLLTIHFVTAQFMLAYILEACTSRAVTDAFAELREKLGYELFSAVFPILLGDNGSEFSNPRAIEADDEGERLCRVYYCDPLCSQQKGALENNHYFIRKVIPKGTSMNPFNQEDVSLMMNHINSYSRKTLNDRTPYYIFGCLYGFDILIKLGAELIPPADIILRPALLKK